MKSNQWLSSITLEIKCNEGVKFKEISRPYWRDQADPEIGNTALAEFCCKQMSLSYCVPFWMQESKMATVPSKLKINAWACSIWSGTWSKHHEPQRDAKGTYRWIYYIWQFRMPIAKWLVTGRKVSTRAKKSIRRIIIKERLYSSCYLIV